MLFQESDLNPKRLSRYFSRSCSSILCWQLPLILFCSLITSSASILAGPLVTVSAAHYDRNALTPEAIVAGFGTQLATDTFVVSGDADPVTPGIQLPTELGGRTVEVNGRKAGLFFVSPNQINYVIPAEIGNGTATVQVRAGSTVVADGTIQVYQTAPGIFTANSSGRGVPAATALRVKANNDQISEEIRQFDQTSNSFVPKPIDLGPAGEKVFLILYLSGIRRGADPNNDGNLNEGIRVIIGGAEVIPLYAGKQGGFAGLDQINVELPRTLIGLGRISLTVTSMNGQPSNPVDVDIAAGGGVCAITGFGSMSALAGNSLSIAGDGFSASRDENAVSIVGAEGQVKAQVIDALTSRLTVLVPFGAETGKVTVQTPACAGTSGSQLQVRTSLSGFLKDTQQQKLKGVTVRVKDTSGKTTTVVSSSEGSFVAPDLAPGFAFVEIDGTTVSGGLPYPKIMTKREIKAGRDNQLEFPATLQQITGVSLPADLDGRVASNRLAIPAPAAPEEVRDSNPTADVRLDLPAGAVIRNPDGTPVSSLSLTLVNRSQTPVALPPAQFSSTIVLIAPVGATITPGGRLTFPNTDGFPVGAQVRLFKLDQRTASDTLGQFIDAGPATITGNGQEIVTAENAVTEATYYFVSIQRQMVTLVGRVTELNRLPVRRAIVDSRGQSIFTDGNGGFVVRDVPVNAPAGSVTQPQRVIFVERDQMAADSLDVQANFMRPTSVVDRSDPRTLTPATGGTTSVPDLVLSAGRPNQNPVITAPSNLNITAGQTGNFDFIVTDPDAGQTLRVSVTGAAFASIITGANDLYTLRLTPGTGDAGTYTLIVTAVDNLGGVATRNITLTVR